MERGSKLFELLKTVFIYSGFTDPRLIGWRKLVFAIYIQTGNVILHTGSVLVAIYFFIAVRMGPTHIIFYLGFAISCFMTSFRVILCRVPKLKSLSTRMFEDEQQINNSSDEGIRSTHTAYTDRMLPIIRVYLANISLALIFYSFICLLLYIGGVKCEASDKACEKRLPAPLYIPFNTDTHFGYAITTQAILMIYLACMKFSAELFYIGLIANSLVKLNILRHVLQNFAKYVDREALAEKSGQKLSFYLARQCIAEHQYIVREFEEFKRSISFLFILEASTQGLQIATFLFVALYGTDKVLNFLSAVFIIYMFFQMLSMYWHAQKIIEESQGIATAILESNWYTRDKKTQQCFLLMILRSQKHLALKAGPFYEMDLAIFLRIVKTVYSFLAMFRSTF